MLLIKHFKEIRVLFCLMLSLTSWHCLYCIWSFYEQRCKFNIIIPEYTRNISV